MPEGAPLVPNGLGSLSESKRTRDNEVRQMFSMQGAYVSAYVRVSSHVRV